MDAPNQCRWRARTYPVDAVWPFVPPLLDDEIISSWLVRCALKHGCEPLVLTNNVWPGYRIWSIDPDRSLSAEHAVALGRLSGMTTEALHASTLTAVHQSIAGETMFPHGVAPWLLCLGIRNRRRCRGLQYCPLCFAQREPYYRLQDRCAWHTSCPIHQVALLDCCDRCHAPLCPQLIGPPQENIGRCHRCGYELCSAPVGPSLASAMSFQASTDSLFGGLTLPYGNSRLNLSEWFELAHWMLGVLRCAARDHGSRISSFFDKLDVSVETLHPPPTGLPFEYLAPGERASLLSNVWKMIQAGPDKLISAAVQEEIRRSLLIPQSGRLPFALAQLATVLKVSRQGRGGHLHSGSPRPPSSVLMRWNRLLRKFQR